MFLARKQKEPNGWELCFRPLFPSFEEIFAWLNLFVLNYSWHSFCSVSRLIGAALGQAYCVLRLEVKREAGRLYSGGRRSRYGGEFACLNAGAVSTQRQKTAASQVGC